MANPGKHRSETQDFAKRSDPNYTPRHARWIVERIARAEKK